MGPSPDELDGSDPALYALIIGVGGYPHLPGGAGKKMHRAVDFGYPGQLTSPPRSALAWADFLRRPETLESRWSVPLGSVELLVSPAPANLDPGFPPLDCETPTRHAIEEAFDRWYERCDSHPDNIALFVFVGHGLQASNGETILLPSDFGRSRNRRWSSAFNFERTRTGFLANRAATQIFVVDACRVDDLPAVRDDPDPKVSPLKDRGGRQPIRRQAGLTVFGSSPGQAAYGPPNQPSYLTTALLNGLNGACATPTSDGWWVETNDLSRHLATLMDLAGASDLEGSATDTRGSMKLRRVAEPTVLLHLDCDPVEANAAADLAWHRNGATRRRERPSGETWQLTGVPPGSCEVSADFPAGEYRPSRREVIVLPPRSRQEIPVSQV